MLRLRDGQAALWEAILPPELAILSAELAAVDQVLDDERFLVPFRTHFHRRLGRPSVAIEAYLRLMYLKHRYSLGYETLVKEVGDSISWRRFCRLPLDGAVPHPTTLVKLTRRLGPELVEELNGVLLEMAVGRKLLRSRRLRVDTTVVEADVRYPTDSGLCAHAVSRLARAVRAVQAAGLAARTRFQDRSRKAGKVVRRISHSLGRAGSRSAVDRLTGEMHDLARASLKQATRVLANAERSIKAGKEGGAAAATRLAAEIERVERVVRQTARRLSGDRTIADRVISLCDLDARPIRRGKPQQPTEFGYKLSLADTAEGFVVAHEVHRGNPLDASTLQVTLTKARSSGMRIQTVLADRGYGTEIADQALAAEGLPEKVIPRMGRADPVEQKRSWRHRYRFRAGCEGRISHLRRRHGLRRSRLKGHGGVRIWVGYGILTHNLDRMVALR
jgi:transposase, IS5 family